MQHSSQRFLDTSSQVEFVLIPEDLLISMTDRTSRWCREYSALLYPPDCLECFFFFLRQPVLPGCSDKEYWDHIENEDNELCSDVKKSVLHCISAQDVRFIWFSLYDSVCGIVSGIHRSGCGRSLKSMLRFQILTFRRLY